MENRRKISLIDSKFYRLAMYIGFVEKCAYLISVHIVIVRMGHVKSLLQFYMYLFN